MAYRSSLPVLYHNSKKAYQGYTLIDPWGSNEVYLIDMEGKMVHQWKLAYPPALHSMLLPNGNLLRPLQTEVQDELLKHVGKALAGRGGEIVEVDWDNNLVWKWEDGYMNHTITRLNNGNTMVLRWVRVPDEIISRIPGGFPDTEFTIEKEKVMFADGLQEVTPDGDIVWEWISFDHMKPEEWPICPLCPRNEWTHANSVIEMPDGNFMMCCRHINMIFIIDKKTGDIIWRWGEGELAGPHDPTIVENGNILLFDNGGHRQDGSNISWSRALEINPRTNKVDWEYRSDPPMEFYSAVCSGCQRLPNGNTLICQCCHGRIFEVTRNGEIVWEFVNPIFNDSLNEVGFGKNNWVFRATRYGPDFSGLKGKELDANNYQNWNRVYGSISTRMTHIYSKRKHSVTNYDPVQTYSGFTLIKPLGTDEAWLIDMDGHFVHRWSMSSCCCELLPDGNLLGIGKEGLLELDWDGNMVWKYEDHAAVNHFQRLDNGNTLYLRRVPVPADIQAKVKGGISGTGKDGMMVDALKEVHPSGKVVWEWLGYEHLDPEEDAICPVCHREQWTDGDTCVVLTDGNILICCSRTHRLYIIEKESGKVKWRWGYRELAHPRHATPLENGNILVFDSGLHPYGTIPVGYSRLIEVNPAENKLEWEYRDPSDFFFYSTFMGGCQRLPNGNTLVTESQTGRVFEIVRSSKGIVWEYVNPFYSDHLKYGHNNIVFRAYRYGHDYPGLKGRFLYPGSYEKFERPSDKD